MSIGSHVTSIVELPLEILALITDKLGTYVDTGNLMLTCRRIRDGVLLSYKYMLIEELAPTCTNVTQMRKILHDRSLLIEHSCVHGLLRCLRLLDVSKERADLRPVYLRAVCAHSHLECLQFLHARLCLSRDDVTDSDLLFHAASYSHAHFDEDFSLSMTGRIESDHLSTCAPRARARSEEDVDRVAVMEFLRTEFLLSSDDARADNNAILRAAAADGHVAVLRYLHTTFNLLASDARAGDNFALCHASENGHLAVVQYLHTGFGLTVDDARAGDCYALRYASEDGHLPVVHYLHTAFGLSAQDARSRNNHAMLMAAWNGHLPVIRYLHLSFELTSADTRGEPFADYFGTALEVATRNHHDNVVTYLRAELGVPDVGSSPPASTSAGMGMRLFTFCVLFCVFCAYMRGESMKWLSG